MIAVAFLRDLPAVQEKLEQSQQNSEGKCPTTKFGRNISCSNTFVLIIFCSDAESECGEAKLNITQH